MASSTTMGTTSTSSGSGKGAGGSSRSGRTGSQKTTHSRSYPRGVGLDFRKLAGLTLLSYIDHHGVSVRPEAPPSELAVAVARHFEQLEVDEEACIGGFLQRLDSTSTHQNVGSSGSTTTTTTTSSTGQTVHCPRPYQTNDYARSTAYFDGRAPPLLQAKRRRSKMAARPGEQVAAKVTRTEENGSWILASVQRFYADTETYDVQDEDDTSKLIRLPWSHVMRLSNGTEGVFFQGTDCMAIFPETTSFYRAKVSKRPVWRLSSSSSAGGTAGTTTTTTTSSSSSSSSATTTPVVKELVVKFEDDEDENGKTPHRRVPSRYVIPIPANYFYEEDDDVDLSPPGK